MTGTVRARLRASGRPRASGASLVVSVIDDPESKGGVVVSVRRGLGSAPRRNRIRRQIREIVRLEPGRIAPGRRLLVTVQRLAVPFGDLEQELWRLVDRLESQ